MQDEEGEIEVDEVMRAVRKMESGKAGGYVAYRQRW